MCSVSLQKQTTCSRQKVSGRFQIVNRNGPETFSVTMYFVLYGSALHLDLSKFCIETPFKGAVLPPWFPASGLV